MSIDGAKAPACWGLLALLSFAIAGWGAESRVAPAIWPPDSPASAAAPRLLVGVVIQGRERGILEVLREGDAFLFPLEPLLELTSCQLEIEAGGARVRTPLGQVPVDEVVMRRVSGVAYLEETFLEQDLATPVVFDSASYAVHLDLPWPVDVLEASPAAPPLEPDAKPPFAGISLLESDLEIFGGRDNQSFATSTSLGGRLAEGWWRLRYRDDLEGTEDLRDFAWLRTFGKSIFQAGHQRVRLHPMLRPVEMTGVQLAWSSQPAPRYPAEIEPGDLLPRRGLASFDLGGEGPPAGFAELWVDDSLVARHRIGLDGTYSFDVELPPRYARLEVRLFERHDPTTPVEIVRQRRYLSAELLPGGVTVHGGGVGWGGNGADGLFGPAPGGEAAGFYRFRHAPSDRLTFEGAVQHANGSSQAMASAVARVGQGLLLSLGMASSEEGKTAWSFDIDGQKGPWELLLRSRQEEVGFVAGSDSLFYDHHLELAYAPSRTLRLGVVARQRRDGLRRIEILDPTFYWIPSQRWSLAGRPTSEGEYRFDLRYRVPQGMEAIVFHQGRTFGRLVVPTGARSRWIFGADVGDGQGERYSLRYSWNGLGKRRPSLAVGPVWAAEELGFEVQAALDLGLGLQARLELEQDPLLAAFGAENGLRFQLGLSLDLALARGRPIHSRRQTIGRREGGVAGRVRIEGIPGRGRYALGGIVLLLDGRPAGRTEPGGAFFLGNLEPGTYRLALDLENLPIELVPEPASRVVQVAAAAVTRADLQVRPELGVAGRVLDPGGRPVPGLWVYLEDLDGLSLASAETDAYGLYRIDRVPLGRYRLRTERSAPEAKVGGDGAVRFAFERRLRVVEAAEREVEVFFDFLFGQDLVLERD